MYTIIQQFTCSNRYVNWDQRGFGIIDDMSQFYLGNMYTTYWPTIEDVCGVFEAQCITIQTGTELCSSELSGIVYQHICFP